MTLTFANKVTAARILIVPFFILTVLDYTPERDYLRFVAFAMFMVAIISDVFDGYIARTRHQKTKAGAILDPLADKMLLISAFGCLYQVGPYFEVIRFPIWLVVALVSRDVILILGGMIIQMVTGRLEIEANIWGKATAFLQVICVTGILLQISISQYVWPAALVVTFISSVIYIREGIRIINGAGSPHFR